MQRGLNFLMVMAFGLGLGACATTSKFSANAEREFQTAPSEQKRIEVPLIVQEKAQCGPATLTMALKHFDSRVELKTITDMSFTPKAEGSFQQDILSATRRAGFAPYPVETVGQMIDAVEKDLPVVVFQNLGFSWSPVWHYALIVGYEKQSREFLLHTGDQAFQKVPLALFLKTWERADRWSYVMAPPEIIPPMGTLQQSLENAAVFSRRGQNAESFKLYEAASSRFQDAYLAPAGMGIALAEQGRTRDAITAFERAIQRQPDHPGLYFNLATLYLRENDREMFEKTKQKSLEMASDEGRQELLRRYSAL